VFFLAIIVGISAGLVAVIIKNSVHLIQSLIHNLVSSDSETILYIFFPLIGITLALLFANFIVKKHVGHGIPTVLFSISKTKGRIRPHNMFSSIVASALTVGFGGSVGLEGPTVATGAAVGSNLGRMFHLNYKQVVLLLGCACTGAMAAIFKAPVAAIVFALEVIMLDLTMASLVPLLLASLSAILTSYLFMGQGFIYPVNLESTFVIKEVPLFVVLGIFAGFLSVYFTKMYMWVGDMFKKVKNKWYRLLSGGLLIGLLVFLFPSLYGEGYEVINAALSGDAGHLFENTIYSSYSGSFIALIGAFVLVLLFKVIATSATFSAGGVGGIFAPSLFLGANLGLMFALIANHLGYDVSPTTFALVGMAGTIAGIIHAPFMSIFLIAEITGGYQLFIPLMIVSTISYVTVKLFTSNSVYTIQLAKRGELITHHKDKALLSMLSVDELIETNFHKVYEGDTLRDVVQVISKSKRNVYPVVDADNVLKGIVVMDDIRDIIFKPELYDEITVQEIMISPKPYLINVSDNMESVAEKFHRTGNFNLPVVEEGRYIGFISRARVFSHYRRILKQISDD
jgi:CIC family chloride channel protein